MRVLHVIPSIGPLRGGPSVAMGLIARALHDAGVSVDVATTNDNDSELLRVPIGTPVDEDGVRYWYFTRSSYPYTTSAGLAKWLRTRIREYDIVHAHALFSFSTTAAALAASRNRIPYIIRPLGTLASYGMQQHPALKQLSWLMLERRLLKRAAAVHFTSEAEREEAARLGDWRSVVVPLGVEPVPVNRRASDTALTFLFLSRLHPKKRVDLLLRAFALAHATDGSMRLLIAGRGEDAYVSEMTELARSLGIAPSVEWLGHVTGPRKLAALERAHAFVLPSVNENFGIAPVEALAAGLPVVLTRGVAIHREVEAADAGIIAGDDADSLAKALIHLRDATVRSTLSANAERLARDKFSIESMQRGLVQMYKQILGAA